MPASMTDNAPAIRFSTDQLSTPTIGQNSKYNLRGLSLPNRADDNEGVAVAAEDDGTGSGTGTGGDSGAGATVSTGGNLHLNHFVSATPRYDDTKYVQAERSRAGFYSASAKPALSLFLTQGYFMGDGQTGYAWVTGEHKIEIQKSRMMRYRIQLTNMTDEQIALNNFPKEAEEGVCVDPHISLILPACEGFGAAETLNNTNFTYVPYKDLEAGTADLNEDGKIDDSDKYFSWDYETKPRQQGNRVIAAARLDSAKPIWTYYLSDTSDEMTEDNQFPLTDTIDFEANSSVPRLNDPMVGGDLLIQDKYASTTSDIRRKFLTWHFSGTRAGDADSSADRGVLRPGQSIVIEMMMPVSAEATDAIDEDLLIAETWGWQPTKFYGHQPEKKNPNDPNRAMMQDTRDSNLDGRTAQEMIVMQLSALKWEKSIHR